MSPEGMEQAPAVAKEDRLFRAGVMIACGIATLLMLASFIPVITAGPHAKGFQWMVAFFAVPIYGVFVVPAFLFALGGERVSLTIAAILLVIGALVALYIFAN